MKPTIRFPDRRRAARRLLPLLLCTVLVGALSILGFALMSASGTNQSTLPVTRTTLTSTPIGTAVSSQGNTEALRYEDPTVKALSITQQLERSITLPYIKGL